MDVDPDTGQFSYSIDPSSPLAAGTYTFQTTQDEDAGTTGTSAPQTFTVALQDPSAVTSLTATPASPTEIDLAWDPAPASDFVTSFSVYLSTDYGATFTHYADTADGTATGMNITGLTANTPYEFNVIANNDTGSSPDSISPVTWTQSGIAAPTGLTVTDQGLDGIQLTWINHSISDTAYEVEAKWAGSDQFQRIATLDPDTTNDDAMTYQFTDWPTESVTFRVRAVGAGESAYSTSLPSSADITSFTDHGNVTNLAFGGYDFDGAILNWDQDDYNGYQIIYRKLTANPGSYGPWDLEHIIPHSSMPTSDPMEDHLDWDYLAWPDGVQVAVRSSNEITGAWSVSNIITIGFGTENAPASAATTPTISNLVVDNVDGTDNFTYNAPASGITYTLFNAASPAGGEASYITTLSGTSAAIPFGDRDATNPLFVILATDNFGNASLSNVIDADFAADPGTLTAKNILDSDGNNAVSLEWDNNSYNEDGYEIQWSAVGGTDDADWHPVNYDATTGTPSDPTTVASRHHHLHRPRPPARRHLHLLPRPRVPHPDCRRIRIRLRSRHRHMHRRGRDYPPQLRLGLRQYHDLVDQR